MTFVAHSVSKFKVYDKCPAQYYYRYIEKLPEPPVPAMERGKRIHEACAKFLTKESDEVIPEMEKFGVDMFRDLRELNPLVEYQQAFDAKWQPLQKWFDKNAYMRVAFDVYLNYGDRTALVIDHKTGKKYPEDDQFQMKIYALGVLKMDTNCDIRTVETRLWYLDQADEEVEVFGRGQIDVLKSQLAGKMLTIDRDHTYKPNPGQHCKWCAFANSAGGPCQFG